VGSDLAGLCRHAALQQIWLKVGLTMNIQLDDVDDDILNSLAVEHDNFRVSNRPYLLTARSLLSLLIIIVIYATQAAHTHTTAYNHIRQHTQNYMLRSIKNTEKD